MDDREARELQERVRRLERELGALQGLQGYDRQPGLNLLGQSTKVSGNLEVTGKLTVGGLLTFSGITGTWTPVFTGFSSDPGSVTAGYILIGRLCYAWVYMATNGTSNAGYFTVTAPFTAASGYLSTYGNPGFFGVDNNAGLAAPPLATITASGTYFNLYKDTAGTTWTAANGKRADFGIAYLTA